ncbi:hypothetical protein MP228_003170 [Amoeboaphelidium protococcarum]|nr:hypothetical protein MP228_003170 [Amoeboaphelidium protococcarum]
MPLIVLTGKPLSGKTTIANKLIDKIPGGKSVQLINDGLADGEHDQAYSTDYQEKKIRGSILSQAEKYISKDSIVIMDAMNNIKSCRYQLYCVARAVPTQYCVVYVNASDDDIRDRNMQHGTAAKYSDAVLSALMMRYEEPISTNRWDSPLFNIFTSNNVADGNSESEIDWQIDQIISYLQSAVKLRPTLATRKTVSPSVQNITDIDQITSEIVAAVLKCASEGMDIQSGGCTILSYATPLQFTQINSATDVRPQELKRLRRQFLTLNRMVGAHSGIGEAFIQYLNANVGS